MISSTTRQFLSVGGRRVWSGNVAKSLGVQCASSYQSHEIPNNNFLRLSKRLMSSNNNDTTNSSDGSQIVGGSDGTGSFPHESSSFTVPSFGSSPISPQDVDSTVTGITTTTATESSSTLSAETTAAIAKQLADFHPTWWPSDQALVLINYIDQTAGMPSYAYAIGATTLALRLLLFPLFVKGQRNSSRMGHMKPELDALKENLEKMGDKIDQASQVRHVQHTKALFKKYNCNPAWSIAAPLGSAPIFMSMFFGLRNATEYFPDLLANGGMLWFTDLCVPDPYMILPVFSAATFLAMTEVGKEQMMASDPVRGRTMINAFRAMAVVMVPLTMNFNAGVFVYWTVNNTFSFLQAVVLKQPAVKRYFGIWDPPKPVPGQGGGSIIDEIKGMMEKKKPVEPNALDKDRVKAHNEIISQQRMVVKKLKEKEGLNKGKQGRKNRFGK